MTTLEALEIGRARIADPARWGKGDGSEKISALPPNCECPMTAIPFAAGVARALLTAAGVGNYDEFFRLHDAPETTHEMVMGWFAKAIATERSKANG